MAKDRKYISSGGLAFTEQRDMNKLSRLAEQGWLLESFAPFGYYVGKGEPQQLTYSVDYNDVQPSQIEGYTEFFEASGWTKVCSSGHTHIFSASRGTKPIYTDRDTKFEKYKKSVQMIKPLLVVPLLTAVLFALLFLLRYTGDLEVIENVLMTAGLTSLILSVPILMVYTSYSIRLNRMK